MQNYPAAGDAQEWKKGSAAVATTRQQPNDLKKCFKCENSHKRKDIAMKKILVMDVPEHIDKVSVSYASLVGVSTKQVKLHSLPLPKHVEAKSLEDASIQMCQDTGWNMCLDAIKNLSE